MIWWNQNKKLVNVKENLDDNPQMLVNFEENDDAEIINRPNT